MAESALHVELVAADRLVWSGEATLVVVRTVDGDLGVLPGHAPLMSVLVPGVVDVQTADGESWSAAVDTGFLSVANNRVSILSEYAQLSHEIDLEKARGELERLHEAGVGDGDAAEAVRSAEARVRAAERQS